jgi:hypothetical protein
MFVPRCLLYNSLDGGGRLDTVGVDVARGAKLFAARNFFDDLTLANLCELTLEGLSKP